MIDFYNDPLEYVMSLIKLFQHSLSVILALAFVSLLAEPLPADSGDFPYKLDIVQESITLGSGIAGLGIYIALPAITNIDQNDQRSESRAWLNPLDSWSAGFYNPPADTASTVLLAAMATVPCGLLVPQMDQGQWDNTLTLFTMYGETLVCDLGLNMAVKRLTGRGRPYVYDTGISDAQKEEFGTDYYESFYSGHTSISFSSAVFLSIVFDKLYPGTYWTPVIWTTSLIAAATVGCLRIAAGKHYLTDVMVGAAAGAATGWLIPWMHEKRKDDRLTLALNYSEGINLQINYALK